MNAKNCRRCGKLFTSHMDRSTCGICFEASLETFMAVKEFLYEFPGSNIVEVVNGLRARGVEISNNEILEFIKDDRIVATGLSGTKVEIIKQSPKVSNLAFPVQKQTNNRSSFHTGRR